MMNLPTETQPNRNLRRERRRWDDADSQSLAVGCSACADLAMCGGLHKKQDAFSCLDDCCGNAPGCDSICPRNPSAFVMRLREINGFDLGNIPRAAARAAPTLPSYVPLIYHGNRRDSRLEIAAAAIPLHKLYHRRDGGLRYSSRAEIAAAFGLSEQTKIILVGYGRDKTIETWWGLSTKRRELTARLANLGLEVATSPNYSLFTDQTRYDDMYNIKRIGIAWQEFVAEGLPCALHLNARTERDYERLADFIESREEATDVVFEFGTGGGWPGRREFHCWHLAEIARYVNRPLHMVMVGGATVIPEIAAAYDRLTFIDTTAFMTAINRQRLVEGNDLRLTKKPQMTAAGAPIDSLLAANIDTMRRRFERIINESRLTMKASDTPPTQRTLERTVSAQVVQS